MRHYLMEERYGQGRSLDGLVPVVRGPDYNVIVSSLGADKQRCTELSASICNYLNGEANTAARTMRAALEVALRFLPAIPPHDPNRHVLDSVKAAIAAAEAAGIK